MPEQGSPPHTRGIPYGLLRLSCVLRITPAYAGNTRADYFKKRRKEDHPRIRGEYSASTSTLASFTGSPPHTRGIQLISKSLQSHIRITPAYAGNTIPFVVFSIMRKDHPRIRGEYTKKMAEIQGFSPSSSYKSFSLT